MQTCLIDCEPRESVGSFLRNHRRELPAHSASIGALPRHRDRVGHAITQEEMAEAIGVSRVWYAMIESGAAQASPRLLHRIAVTLGFGPDESSAFYNLVVRQFIDSQTPVAS